MRILSKDKSLCTILFFFIILKDLFNCIKISLISSTLKVLFFAFLFANTSTKLPSHNSITIINLFSVSKYS